jgi:hypothetical protein
LCGAATMSAATMSAADAPRTSRRELRATPSRTSADPANSSAMNSRLYAALLALLPLLTQAFSVDSPRRLQDAENELGAENVCNSDCDVPYFGLCAPLLRLARARPQLSVARRPQLVRHGVRKIVEL